MKPGIFRGPKAFPGVRAFIIGTRDAHLACVEAQPRTMIELSGALQRAAPSLPFLLDQPCLIVLLRQRVSESEALSIWKAEQEATPQVVEQVVFTPENARWSLLSRRRICTPQAPQEAR